MATPTRFPYRPLLTLLLAAAFLATALTGVLLDFAPHRGGWSGWSLLGISRHGWSDFHAWAGYVSLVIVAAHLACNRKSLLAAPARLLRGLRRRPDLHHAPAPDLRPPAPVV